MQAVRSGVLATLVATAGLATAAAPAGAAPVATIWPGWDAVGPAPGIDADAVIAASGTTIFAIRGVHNGESGARQPFVVDVGGTQRVGTLDFPTAGNADAAAPTPTRLIAQSRCSVRRSDDAGATWSVVTLPDCTSNTGSGLAFSDADHGFATTSGKLWSTADGGLTWKPTGTLTQQINYTPPLVVALGPATLLQNPDGKSLRRSEDGGATWKTIPLPAAGGALMTSLPSVGVPTRRAGGDVLLGVRGAVLRSTDQGKTFTRRDAPTPPELAGAKDLDVPRIACDPAGTCVADIDDPGVSTRHQGLRYTDAGFGASVPGLPRQSDAPATNVIVGLLDLPTATALVRSTNAGQTYAPVITGATAGGDLGRDGLLGVLRGDRFAVSPDHGETFSDSGLPGPSPIEQAVAAPGGTVALTEDGKIHRLVSGAWQDVADASAILPTAIAVAGDVPVVSGSRGVALLSAPPAVVPVSASALAGRSFSGVTARGKTIVLWSGGRYVRSTDGGRRWSATRLSGRITDIRLVDGTFASAVVAGRLMTSRNGGKTFKAAARPIPLGDGAKVETAAFHDARNGVVTGDSGVQVTTDGGRSFRPVPTPGAGSALFADATAGGGVVVQDQISGDLYRFLGAAKAPKAKITIKVAGALAPHRDRTVGKGKKRRTVSSSVKIAGRITGAPLDARVTFVTQRSKSGAPEAAGSTDVNADGTFRRTVRLDPGDRVVRVWYGGVVLPSGTVGGSSSGTVAVRR
ncbi:hypothetical protein AB0L40_21635 [Patulibacter sp. NPDC049589]|uniref:WD40/YVTN/BNR-like repeat-containing protein n=1 Tax=Patulibacter sp. NPDC049589 TaxID=3154731 RepID=UPI0034287CCA